MLPSRAAITPKSPIESGAAKQPRTVCRMIRFDHRAVPIVLAAVVVDVIGFGIVMPVLPALITELGHVDLADGDADRRLDARGVRGRAVLRRADRSGNLGDRFGRRPVLIAAMLGFSARLSR